MKEKLAEWINVIFGFRKFLLMLTLLVVGIVFRLKDLISGAEMVDLFKNTTVAFMAANGVEHLIAAVQNHMAGGKPMQNSGPADTDESDDENEVDLK